MNEILKKRIEEAERIGSEHYNSNVSMYRRGKHVGYLRGFSEGAEYALSHQWISVEEALPEVDEKVLFIDKNGRMQLLTMNDIRGDYNIWHSMFMGVSRDLLEERICYLDKIIAWMPIPKFETNKKEDIK